jgi:subtilisin family serine protease
VKVAVIDTGLDLGHPDIAPNVWTNRGETGSGRESNGLDDDHDGFVDDVHGWDFVDGDASPTDPHGHGTHVAGIIGASGNNGTGTTGIAWDVSLMPLRVLGADGVGSTSDISIAIDFARNHGAHIANLSLAGSGYSQSLAATMADSTDMLFTVAAGNDGADNDSTPSYPCNFGSANVLCVASITSTGALSSFSNYGDRHVDLAAPGSMILSTVPDGYGYASGTSMASPQVAGAAAILEGAAPDATTSAVADALLQGVAHDPALVDKTGTGGRLDLATSLDLLVPPAPVDPPVVDPEPTTAPGGVTDTPTPDPTPSTGPAPVTYETSVTLRLTKRLMARGTVVALDDGAGACVAGTPVTVTRNGVPIATVMSDLAGRFRAILHKRRGTYRASIDRRELGSLEACAAATSTARHFR